MEMIMYFGLVINSCRVAETNLDVNAHASDCKHSMETQQTKL